MDDAFVCNRWVPANAGNFLTEVGDVEVVRGEKIDLLADEWDALALRTGASPFARPGWIRAWWAAFGHGELRLFSYRRDDDLTAVLPLSLRRGRLHSCSNVHTPVFDGVAAEAADFEPLLQAALRQAWAGLVLGQLDARGRLAGAARNLAEKGGCSLLEFDSRPSSRVRAMPVAEFEAGMRGKRRRETGRGARKLAELGEVHFEVLEGAPAAARFDDFLRLEANDWKLKQGTAIRQSPQVRGFYADIFAWAAQEEILRLAFMYLDERPIVVQMMADGNGCRYALKTGFDGEFSRHSSGVIHLLEEIHASLEAGRDFEMGIGDEGLKRELRSDSWPLESIGLFPPTRHGALSRKLVAGRMRAYERARESDLLRRLRDTARRLRAGRN